MLEKDSLCDPMMHMGIEPNSHDWPKIKYRAQIIRAQYLSSLKYIKTCLKAAYSVTMNIFRKFLFSF